MLLRSLLLGALAVAGCATRTLPTSTTKPEVDMATAAADLATAEPRDLALPRDLSASPDLDFAIESECSGIVECVMDCRSSDTACITKCKAGHTAAALMDADSMLACAIPACASAFAGNGGDGISGPSCIATHCSAQEATCGIPLPPP